jgi:hypothetical protein
MGCVIAVSLCASHAGGAHDWKALQGLPVSDQSQQGKFISISDEIKHSSILSRSSCSMENIKLDLQDVKKELQLLKFQPRGPRGISTAANWVSSIRDENLLIVDNKLNHFLENCAVEWWPTPKVMPFPNVGATESKTCQDFVNTIIKKIINCDGNVYKIDDFGNAQSIVLQFPIHSQPVDCHKVVSFSGRKPDICCYQGDRRGAYLITLVGDVKGCGARTADFPEAEIGHILDMTTDLLVKHQFTRLFIYCFLTDGCKFQFFKVRRCVGNVFRYEQSAVYCNEKGWQVR